jgi:hypothetical protein
MNVIVFGATGMVGRGVTLECLEDPRVRSVLSLSRRSSGITHAKFRERLLSDLMNIGEARGSLTNIDACFFCLGVSAAGMSEAAYTRVTYDLTMSVAKVLVALNPQLTFCYVTGQGTDSSEKGRFMWARVKGKTENDLMRLVPNAYMFRPGFIQPMKGVRSSTRLYQTFYDVSRPLFPLFRRVFPNHVTTSVNVGRAMIRVAASGYPKRILETRDINDAAQ